MDLYKINLNLLVALNELLQLSSVTLAAERLELTQSAMSNNLKQLRQIFNDQLLVRNGQSMALTVLGKELKPKLRQVLQHVQNLVQSSQAFDPKTSTRNFTVALSEHLVPDLLPKLTSYLAKHAPSVVVNIVLEVFCGSESPFDEGGYDIAVTRLSSLDPRVKSQMLLTGTMMCIMSKRHPLASKKKITMEEYLKYEHVGLKVNNSTPLIVDYALAKLGVSRKLRITTSSPHVLLYAVAHSNDLLGTMYEKSILTEDQSDCVFKPLPFEVEQVNFCMCWHEREEEDMGHKWLRGILSKILTGKALG